MRATATVSKCVKLSYLPPDGLLALAAWSAPQSVVAEIIEEIEAGDDPPLPRSGRRLRGGKRQPPAGAERRKAGSLSPIVKERTNMPPPTGSTR